MIDLGALLDCYGHCYEKKIVGSEILSGSGFRYGYDRERSES